MSQEIPIVLISPEARAALAEEGARSGLTGELTGGLLFGHPLNGGRRLVVSSVRLSSDVGFGRRDFSLDQTRTSRQLDHARGLAPKANYSGIWYLHRTPNRELTDDEWVQAQTMLEDPDFPFKDLVCLVLCFYSGELTIHASSFNRNQSARGQAPTPTELRLTTDWMPTPTPSTHPPPRTPPTEWYKSPDVAARLGQEYQQLSERYQIELALAPNGQMFYRLSPIHRYEKLSFYLTVGPGFPTQAPHVFLLIAGQPHRISAPSLGSWAAHSRMVDLADELVEWLAFSLDDYFAAANRALDHGDSAAAADLLTLVLAVEPRTPGAARLLAKAQAAPC